MQKNDLKILRLSLNSLTIFDDILKDNKVTAFVDLLDALSIPEVDCQRIYRNYFRFYKEMIGFNWRIYLIDLIIKSENKLALTASASAGMKQCLLDNAERDLKIIEKLSNVYPQEIIELITLYIDQEMSQDEQEMFTTDLSPSKWPVWDNYILANDREESNLESISAMEWLKQKKTKLKEKFYSNSWAVNTPSLLDYYLEVGYGLYSDFVAFRVSDSGYELEGIQKPDPITIGNLICQEREQSIVLRNTEFFLDGFRANNIILYGNRGTGKSSLVKALLNEYAAKGLRLVQLKKNQMDLFPLIIGQLSKVPLKFIVFIDDLSFDATEESYKSLKSLLEGGVEVRPDNVLIYATSNRKHLITENFAERTSDVHGQDNIEEKLSLADRFGITVTFLSPDQESYLQIVEGLATQDDLRMDKDELRERAKKWTLMHNSRSGRTARQFVDYLKGELAIIERK